MDKKNIVILIDWFLPGNKAGGPVKSVYSMLTLLKPYFNFSVITTNCDLGSSNPYSNIEPDVWTSFNEIPVYYFSKQNLNDDKLAEVINQRNPDIIYLNSFWSKTFSILPLRLNKVGKIKGKIVLAPRGMLGQGALSIKPLKKKLALRFFKWTGLHNSVVFHATTSEEQAEIRNYSKSATIKIAANLNTTELLKNRTITKESGELKLFFLSRISRVKNLHFALEVLANLKTNALITYDIYGSMEDAQYWKECELIIKTLAPNIKVSYKGELSFEQVQPVINTYHFLFLPTLNENFGHSIAETLKSACPVIISRNTPWTKVNENHCGYAIDLASKNDFVKVIESAAQLDNDAYKRMSENCIKFMEQVSNYKKDIEDYLKLFS